MGAYSMSRVKDQRRKIHACIQGCLRSSTLFFRPVLRVGIWIIGPLRRCSALRPFQIDMRLKLLFGRIVKSVLATIFALVPVTAPKTVGRALVGFDIVPIFLERV